MKRHVLQPRPTDVAFLVLLVALASYPALPALAQGTTTTIAMSGDQAPDTPAGALFGTFRGLPLLNDAGQTAYFATLENFAGGVDPANEEGIWSGQTLVVRQGSQAPGMPAGVKFDPFIFGISGFNDAGQTAYRGFLQLNSGVVDETNDNGIWRDTTLIAREGTEITNLPGGGQRSDRSGGRPVLNDNGQTAYRGYLQTGVDGVDFTNNSGIWRDSTLLAREGLQAPGMPAGVLFKGFDAPVINAAGQTVYRAVLQTGVGGIDSTNNRAIWRDSTLVARVGSQVPGMPTGVLFTGFGIPVLNDAGQMAYLAGQQSDVGGVDTIFSSGIWRDSTFIAQIGSQAPGTPAGVLFSGFFGDLVLNNAGQIAYRGRLQIGVGGVDATNDIGIWRDQTLIAREGSQAPGTPEGTLFSDFFDFGRPVINDAGQVAYVGFLQSRPGSANNSGIWITGTNGQSLLVARKGDSLSGRTIRDLSFANRSGGSDGRGRGLNNFSQLAFRARFLNGDIGIFLFTPDIRWTSATSGSWDSSANWTIGQLPGNPHDVFITPEANLTVTGPTGSVAIANLTIGGGGGSATLELNGGTINPSGAVVVTPTGVLTGDGTIGGEVQVFGNLTPGSGPGLMTFGGDLTMEPLANLDIELGGLTPGSQFDVIDIGGDALLNGTLDISLIGGFTLGYGNSFEILDITGTQSGTFAGLADGAMVGNFGGIDLFIDYTGGDGNDVRLFTIVPEPNTLALAMLLLGGAAAQSWFSGNRSRDKTTNCKNHDKNNHE